MNTSTDPATLTKAVLLAAERLGLTNALPQILGIDALHLARMARGEAALARDGAEWAVALKFAGLYRSLLSLLDSPANARTWLTAPHQTLGGSPADLLRTAAGRDHVFKYLDAVQKYEMKLPPRSNSE